jgi:phosphatidylglycerol:prolipoprotein diacylglycerol transferase
VEDRSIPTQVEVGTVGARRARLRRSGDAVIQHAADPSARPLQVVSFACEPLADAKPKALGLTYWFDTATEGEPYRVTIRLAGRRIGVKGKPGPRDRFSVAESVDPVVPGSGPIAVTTRVLDLAPGRWDVPATPGDDPRPGSGRPRSASTRRPRLAKASSSGTTLFAPIVWVRAPGARLGAWPALVGLGAAVALTVQAQLAAHSQFPVTRVLLLSLGACAVGLLGAKLYYLTGHYLRGRRPSLLTAGMCIQGFVLGAIGTLVVSVRAAGVAVGPLPDVTAPGLLFGMTIGRFGCFFGGCCAGRSTPPAGACGPRTGAWGCAASPPSCSSPRSRCSSAWRRCWPCWPRRRSRPGSCSSARSPPTPSAGSCCSRYGPAPATRPTAHGLAMALGGGRRGGRHCGGCLRCFLRMRPPILEAAERRT